MTPIKLIVKPNPEIGQTHEQVRVINGPYELVAEQRDGRVVFTVLHTGGPSTFASTHFTTPHDLLVAVTIGAPIECTLVE